MAEKLKRSVDFEKFDRAMATILKADPAQVKAAMEAEKRERTEEARRTGKRGRGRPPSKRRRSSASARASSEKD